jgi:LCP family protein required for cell wall assembly
MARRGDTQNNTGTSAKPAASIRRAGTQRRLGVALVIVSVLALIAVGVGAWFYFTFASKVSSANERVDPAIQAALDTPPPTTLVTAPTGSASTDSGGTPSTIKQKELPDVVDLLLLGTDARPGAVESPGSSDVIMLLHVDRRQDFLSILSITRDLWVNIPGYGQDRINAAYYRGGPALTIATLKQTLGVDLTKYVGVGFEEFPGLVDSLGGVYVDVDRKYTDTPWWKFDLAPGYQLLDGDTALLFSRYRFDENADFGRMARQQRMLAGLRDQARGWNKTLKLPGMVNTIMDNAITDLSPNDMLKLAYWLVKLDGTRIKQIIVRGPGKTIGGKAVVVVDQATLAQAVTDFFTPPPPDVSGQASSVAPPARGRVLVAAAAPALAASLAAAPILDAAAWQTAQQGVPFALQAPTSVPKGFAFGTKTPEETGTYGIKVGNGTQPAVRVTYRYLKTDLYLGFSATTWTAAPLASDGMAVESNGIVYTVSGTLGNPDHVWWKENGVLYWVSNTLMYTLSDQELLAIAEGMRPVGGAGGAGQ